MIALPDGYCIYPYDPAMLEWAKAAARVGAAVIADPSMQAQWLRHGRTWFVGVDALPSDRDGSIGGVPLAGAWREEISLPQTLHPAQLSVVYPGYPAQDPDETDAAYGYRTRRCAAHVDGLLLEDGRRYPRETHSVIIGVPLDDATASPLMVWPQSHHILRQAFRDRIGDLDPRGVDVTETYKAARGHVFDSVAPVAVTAKPGEVIVLDRHLLHGIAPWGDADSSDSQRMVAYFRPLCADPLDWLAE